MEKTLDYLHAAKDRLGVKSDAAFARELGIERSALVGYQNGTRVIDVWVCAQLAEILDVPAMKIIARAELERGEREQQWKKQGTGEKRRPFWQKVLERF